MAEITIRGVRKTYDNGVEAVRGIDLDVADGELLVLVGPSGCGKSTLLRMVAGLEDVTDGSISIGGREVTYLPPKDRDVAMVFQNYALYPHMTVAKNIAYPLRLAKVPGPERDKRVREVARLLQLEEVLARRPGQLSGGQRQRVAMGRALVREPQAFLMDEPLSNLDAKLRVEMRAEIARLQRDLDVTTLYVTHDQVEAMTMGTRVAVLDRGMLQQIDTPQRIYDAPRNLFVATFIGSPSMNLFAAKITRPSPDAGATDAGATGAGGAETDGALVIEFGGQSLTIDGALLTEHPALADMVGERVVLGIRPEALDDVSLEPDAPADRVIEATVDLVESLGAELVVHMAVTGVDEAAAPEMATEAADEALVAKLAEQPAWEAVAAQPSRTVARLSPRSRLAPGDTVKLAVDPAGVHLFDADTGASLRAGPP